MCNSNLRITLSSKKSLSSNLFNYSREFFNNILLNAFKRYYNYHIYIFKLYAFKHYYYYHHHHHHYRNILIVIYIYSTNYYYQTLIYILLIIIIKH